MNVIVSAMQALHGAAGLPGFWWFKANVWCALRWEKLRRRHILDDAPPETSTMGDR